MKILKIKSILLLLALFFSLIYSFNFVFAGDNDHQIKEGWVVANEQNENYLFCDVKLNVWTDPRNIIALPAAPFVPIFFDKGGKIPMMTLTESANVPDAEYVAGQPIKTSVGLTNRLSTQSALLLVVIIALIIITAGIAAAVVAPAIAGGGVSMGAAGAALVKIGYVVSLHTLSGVAAAALGAGLIATTLTGIATVSLGCNLNIGAIFTDYTTVGCTQTYTLKNVRVCNEIWLDTSDVNKAEGEAFSCNGANGKLSTEKYYRQCSAQFDLKGNDITEVQFEWPADVTVLWSDNFIDQPGTKYMQKSYFCMEKIEKDKWILDIFFPDITPTQEEVSYCRQLPAPDAIQKGLPEDRSLDPYTPATPRPEDKAFCGVYCDTKFKLRRESYKGYVRECTPDKYTYYVGDVATFTMTAVNSGMSKWDAGFPPSETVYGQDESYTKYSTQKDKVFVGLGEQESDDASSYSYRWGISLQGATSGNKNPSAVVKGKIKFNETGYYSMIASVIMNDKKLNLQDAVCGDRPIEVKTYPACSGSISATFTGDGRGIIIPPNTELRFDGRVASKNIKDLVNSNPKVYNNLFTDPACDRKKTEQSTEVDGTFDVKDLNVDDPKFNGVWDAAVITSLFNSCEDKDKCCYVQEIGYCADGCAGESDLRCDERAIAKTEITFQISESATTSSTSTSTGTETSTGTSSSTTTSTPTTTTSETTSTSSTTTVVPEWRINCAYCEIGQNCTCVLEGGVCTNGTWVVRNYQNTPVVPFPRDIPPQFVNFTPNSAGKVEVVTTCFEPFSKVVSLVVEVNPEFMQCPTECGVNKECTCNITNCTAGLFQVNKTEGNPIPNQISISITSTQFQAKFTPTNNGKVEAIAACTNPIKIVKKNITITGEAVPGNFTAKSFTCVQMTGGHKCTLVYNNTLNSNAKVLFMFSDDRDVVITTVGPVIAGQGTGSLEAIFSCANLPKEPIYYASWNAYLEADTRLTNPIAYSKSTDVAALRC